MACAPLPGHTEKFFQFCCLSVDHYRGVSLQRDNGKHRAAAPGRNSSIRREAGEVPQEEQIKEHFEEHGAGPDVWRHLGACPLCCPHADCHNSRRSCGPRAAVPVKRHFVAILLWAFDWCVRRAQRRWQAGGRWLYCCRGRKVQLMKTVTLWTVLLRKGFFLPMFLFL